MGGVIVVIDIDEEVEEDFEEEFEEFEEETNIYIKIQNIILNKNVSNTNINIRNNVVIEKNIKGSDPIPIPYNK
jgi:hypothetical protein